MVMDGRCSEQLLWRGSVLYCIVWCEVYGSVRTSSCSACGDDD